MHAPVLYKPIETGGAARAAHRTGAGEPQVDTMKGEWEWQVFDGRRRSNGIEAAPVRALVATAALRAAQLDPRADARREEDSS